jgi:hypothetical protein
MLVDTSAVDVLDFADAKENDGFAIGVVTVGAVLEVSALAAPPNADTV